MLKDDRRKMKEPSIRHLAYAFCGLGTQEIRRISANYYPSDMQTGSVIINNLLLADYAKKHMPAEGQERTENITCITEKGMERLRACELDNDFLDILESYSPGSKERYISMRRGYVAGSSFDNKERVAIELESGLSRKQIIQFETSRGTPYGTLNLVIRKMINNGEVRKIDGPEANSRNDYNIELTEKGKEILNEIMNNKEFMDSIRIYKTDLEKGKESGAGRQSRVPKIYFSPNLENRIIVYLDNDMSYSQILDLEQKLGVGKNYVINTFSRISKDPVIFDSGHDSIQNEVLTLNGKKRAGRIKFGKKLKDAIRKSDPELAERLFAGIDRPAELHVPEPVEKAAGDAYRFMAKPSGNDSSSVITIVLEGKKKVLTTPTGNLNIHGKDMLKMLEKINNGDTKENCHHLVDSGYAKINYGKVKLNSRGEKMRKNLEKASSRSVKAYNPPAIKEKNERWKKTVYLKAP